MADRPRPTLERVLKEARRLSLRDQLRLHQELSADLVVTENTGYFATPTLDRLFGRTHDSEPSRD